MPPPRLITMSATKPIWQSLTFWSLVLAALGALLAAYADGGLAGIFADEAFATAVGRLLEAAGLTGALYGRVRAKHRIAPAPVGAAANFCIVGVAVSLLVLLSGCAATQTCPDNQGVVVTYTQRAPSSVTARCSGDATDRVRRRLSGAAQGTFRVVCPDGKVPGPLAGSTSRLRCDGQPCTVTDLACVAPGPSP